MRPEVSVILTVYNQEMYLRQCLDSILGQTLREIEIILIDDGSVDGSAKICDVYALRDNRVKVIHKHNEGAVAARKDGLRLAEGKYIAYVDCDDWIELDMYERLHDSAKEADADVVVSDRWLELNEESVPMHNSISKGLYEGQALKDDLYPKLLCNGEFFHWGIYPSLCDKLFLRERLLPIQMAVDNKLTIGDDTSCVLPCLLEAERIVVLNDCFYHYRPVSYTHLDVYKRQILCR